ncbi:MAG: hypothetical protein RLZZ353_219 [Actinomycetota bacterium]
MSAERDGPVGRSVADRPPVSGAVLAGGRSRRLGRDKRFVTVGGEPLLTRTVGLLAAVADDVTVVVADAGDRDRVLAAAGRALAPPRLRTAVDARPDAGPIAGLEAALAAAVHPWVVVLATDHPRLPLEVVALLADAARAAEGRAAVALEGPLGPEPLLAAYRRDAAGAVGRLLDAGTRRLVDVLGTLDPVVVPRATWTAVDPDAAALRDVDTPEDLHEDRAEDRG